MAAAGASRPLGGVRDPLDHRVVVAEPDEDRLVRPGRESDPLVQQGVEEGSESLLVGAPSAVEVHGRRDVPADHADERADNREPGREPCPRTGLAEHTGQAPGPRREDAVDVRRELAQRGQPGGSGERVPGQGSGVEHRAERGQRLHHIAPATDGADRQSAADHLAERREVRSDVVASLGATGLEAEPGDHLVEDQQRADPITLGAQAVEEAGLRRDHAHVGRNRLDDHRRHLRSELGHPVVRHDERLGDRPGWDPGGPGQAEGRHPAAAGSQQRVGGAMEVAVERDDAVAAGEPAGESYCGAGRLGARVHQTDPLAARHALADRLGELHLAWCGRTVRGPVRRGRGQRPGDRRMGVTQDHRAVALHQVDVAPALDVEDVRAVGAGDEVRPSADRGESTDRGVDPARNRLG